MNLFDPRRDHLVKIAVVGCKNPVKRLVSPVLVGLLAVVKDGDPPRVLNVLLHKPAEVVVSRVAWRARGIASCFTRRPRTVNGSHGHELVRVTRHTFAAK